MKIDFVKKIKKAFKPKGPAKFNPLLKEGIEKLEKFHWHGIDRTFENEDEVVDAWKCVYQGILQSDASAEKFLKQNGLTWVYWYVVEQRHVQKSPKLCALLLEIMDILDPLITIEGGKKDKQRRQKIMSGFK